MTLARVSEVDNGGHMVCLWAQCVRGVFLSHRLFPSIHVGHRLSSNPSNHPDSYTLCTGSKHSKGLDAIGIKNMVISGTLGANL